ncbi:MAG: hypothetical protein ACI8UX_001923, partial [Psychromonas sp.]
ALETWVPGQQIIKIPSIDKRTEQSMLFTDHFAGSSVYTPGRAVFIWVMIA